MSEKTFINARINVQSGPVLNADIDKADYYGPLLLYYSLAVVELILNSLPSTSEKNLITVTFTKTALTQMYVATSNNTRSARRTRITLLLDVKLPTKS
jgi:hypothetical protein